MPDKIFVKGLNVTRNDNAPDFILCKVGVMCKDFFEFMKANEKKGWLNFEIKMSKDNKPYAELDTWEPGQSNQTDNQGGYDDYQPPVDTDDIPF